MEHHDYKKEDLQIRSSLLMRVFITFFILFGIFIIIITNFSLTSRFSQETTKQANLRLHLYANLIGEFDHLFIISKSNEKFLELIKKKFNEINILNSQFEEFKIIHASK